MATAESSEAKGGGGGDRGRGGGCQKLRVVSAIFGERCDGKRQKLAAQTVRQR